MRRLASVVLLTASLTLAMVNCGDDGTGVERGSLEVLTSTVGDTLDPDGYTVTTDAVASQPIGINDTLRIPDLAAGSHSVELGDVPVNCRVDGSNPRTLEVDAGATRQTVFDVGCRAALFDHITFSSNRDGNPDIYVMGTDGSNPARLTSSAAHDDYPAWSPDGTRIAFGSYRDGNWEIYVIGAEGSNPVNLTNNPAGDWQPAWSPDGTRIAFTSERDGNWEIYVIGADGSNLVNLTNNPGGDALPAWSPDETHQAPGV